MTVLGFGAWRRQLNPVPGKAGLRAEISAPPRRQAGQPGAALRLLWARSVRSAAASAWWVSALQFPGSCPHDPLGSLVEFRYEFVSGVI